MTGDIGRGSWTRIGGTAPASPASTIGYYQLYDPMVGSQVRGKASVDPDYYDYRAVWAGVKAIQRVLNFDLKLAVKEDGTFGPATDVAVREAQQEYQLVTGFTPGLVGPTLAKRLFRSLVVGTQATYGIPDNLLAGLLDLESVWDPGSVGQVSKLDNGLAQFHIDGSKTWWFTFHHRAEVVITHAMAFDPFWAVDAAGARMAYYRDRYSGKSPGLQQVCSIAQHNAPGYADQWYQTGTPPNANISAYVRVVLNRAAAYQS